MTAVASLTHSDLFLAASALMAVITYTVRTVADVMGWSPSQRTLRQDNDDLRIRNKDLEEESVRLRQTVVKHESRIHELEQQVATLKEHDLTSVHQWMLTHDRQAEDRAAALRALLERIAVAVETN